MPIEPIPVIQFDRVHFSYGDMEVLEAVSFSVNEGDYVGVLGPNGSGKTTLLKIILGLIPPTQGSVRLFGLPIDRLGRAERSRVGFVPQRISEGRMDFPATVEEVVASGRTALHRVGNFLTAKDYEMAVSAMRTAGVEDLRDRLLPELSGGQAQRVLIARALAAEPRLLILDEPTVGVDVPSQESFYSFIKELNERHGITIFFVSHDIDVVVHESKSILCLNRTLICHGPSQEVMTGAVLEKVYGKKLRFVLHGH